MNKKIGIITICLTILIFLICCCFSATNAAEKTKEIVLNDEQITVNGETLSEDSSKGIYVSTEMNNGGLNQEAKDANIKDLTIVNIQESGTYQLSGKLSNGQISINGNKINGKVVLVLNHVEITCNEAPAIFVYHKDTTQTNCEVVIQVQEGTENELTGARIKQSVEGWTDQSELQYYVEKGTDDDGSYYERYKYDGAISSDISLTFEGSGKLTVNSTDKEGIEVKQDITINGGQYIINSMDDGINASADGESVITINDGTILIKLSKEAEEGDGIDSNGSLIINGGKIFAFACETSQDNGIDSENGVEINGGYVVGTSNMPGTISQNSKQEVIQLQFNEKVEAGTLIAIVDQNNTAITALQSDYSYSILTISTPDLTNEEYSAYEGGNIEGTSENGLYTEISSYELGTLKQTNSANMNMPNPFQNGFEQPKQGSNIYVIILSILIILLAIVVILAFRLNKKGEFEMKGKIVTLIIGILIGAIIATAGFLIYNNINQNNMQAPEMGERGQMERNGQMPTNMVMPEGGVPGGQRPEMRNEENNI